MYATIFNSEFAWMFPIGPKTSEFRLMTVIGRLDI